jgi:hypothetical protein
LKLVQHISGQHSTTLYHVFMSHYCFVPELTIALHSRAFHFCLSFKRKIKSTINFSRTLGRASKNVHLGFDCICHIHEGERGFVRWGMEGLLKPKRSGIQSYSHNCTKGSETASFSWSFTCDSSFLLHLHKKSIEFCAGLLPFRFQKFVYHSIGTCRSKQFSAIQPAKDN